MTVPSRITRPPAPAPKAPPKATEEQVRAIRTNIQRRVKPILPIDAPVKPRDSFVDESSSNGINARQVVIMSGGPQSRHKLLGGEAPYIVQWEIKPGWWGVRMVDELGWAEVQGVDAGECRRRCDKIRSDVRDRSDAGTLTDVNYENRASIYPR